MRYLSIFSSLMLCATVGLAQNAFAASFCPVTDDGKIRIDQCKFSSNEECKRKSGSKADCVPDQLTPSDKAPYCLVMGMFEVCDKYFDLESCEQDAQKKVGGCIPNPYYKKPANEQP